MVVHLTGSAFQLVMCQKFTSVKENSRKKVCSYAEVSPALVTKVLPRFHGSSAVLSEVAIIFPINRGINFSYSQVDLESFIISGTKISSL